MTQSRRLNILMVTPSLPYPPIWGFGIRVYQILRHLSERHDVSLLTYGAPSDDSAMLGAICRAVHLVPEPARNKRLAQAASLLSPISFQSCSLRSRAMQAKIDALLRAERFDIIQVESSQMCGFDFGRGARLILDEHNLEYELLYRMYQTERGPLRRLYNWAEYCKFRREEQACWGRADGCLLTSERERDVLCRRLPGKPAATVPNGVDIEFFRPSDTPPDPDSVVFTGLMSYRPNIDAAVHFVQDILPRIHAARPDVTFTVVGAGPTEEVTRLAGPHVVVTGRVPDVRSYVHSAAVVVVPLRMGSGTRLKVLEGLAMGKAMVATSVGAEGIDVRDGEDICLADGPEPFARNVLRLLERPAEAAALGLNGRTMTERRYGWRSVVQSLEEFYARVPAARGADDVAGETSPERRLVTR